jgi:MFS family permease
MEKSELGDRASGPKWVIFLVATFSMCVFTVAYQSVPVIIPQLMTEISISTVQAGLLLGLAVFPGVFLSLPSGWLVNKYRPKKMGMIASVFIAASCILTVISTSYEIMLFGRLILAMGGNMMLITSYFMISQLFSKKELGKAMGFFAASTPLITIATYSGVSLTSSIFSWRFPFYICLLLAIVSIAAFLVLVKDYPNHDPKEAGKNYRKDYFNAELWKICLVLLCVGAATGSFSQWAPTLFTQFANMTLFESSVLSSLSILPTAFLFPFFGYLSDRTRKRRLFVIIGSLIMTLAFISITCNSLSISASMVFMLFALLVGIAETMIMPVLMSMPREVIGVHKIGVGFGLLSIFGALTSVVSSVFIGSLVGVANSLTLPLLTMGAFSAIATIIAFTLKTK